MIHYISPNAHAQECFMHFANNQLSLQYANARKQTKILLSKTLSKLEQISKKVS